MTDPIINTAIQITPDKLHVQWGMTITDGKLNWTHNQLELRLYSDPPLNLTDCQPTTDLFDTSKSSSAEASISLFGLASFAGGKSEERKRFTAGPRADDDKGQSYYPVRIDVGDITISDASVIYPAVTWSPVDSHWLEQDFQVWVVIGQIVKGKFEATDRPKTYHHPEVSTLTPDDEDFILPDMDVTYISYEERQGSPSHRMSPTPPKIFVSYAHKDENQVKPIATTLRDKHYYDVWIDEYGIRAGRHWPEELATSIQQADVILFMMTKHALDSTYCRAEVRHALKYDKRIIPLRLDASCEADNLHDIGLTSDVHYRDYTVNPNRAIELLVSSDLPTVIERDKRFLSDDKLRRLHERYLRQFFKKEFYSISLSDITDNPKDRGVPLTDVYVPLPVDVSVHVEVDNTNHNRITDWWVKTEKSHTIADRATPEELREIKLREWPALKVGQDELQILIDDIQGKLKQREEADSGSWYMEAHDAAVVQPRMVLTGNPGSGKSTFLKHLAICLAGDQLQSDRYDNANRQALRFWSLPAYTPIFISLRDLVATQFPETDDPAGTPEFITYLQAQLGEIRINDYWDELEEQLTKGEAIILLDGLDEVPDAVTEERRDQIINLIDDLSVDFEACRIIISSRPHAYNGDWYLEGFGQTALVPLFDNRIHQLAVALFQQIMEPREAEKQAEEFINHIRQIEDKELRNTPLLFTLMAQLWVTKQDKPASERISVQHISTLYRENVNLMLQRWTRKDVDHGQSVTELLNVTDNELRQIMEHLAYNIQSDTGSDRQATFRSSRLVDAYEDVLDRDPPGVSEALDLLERRAGLLTSERARRYRFTHLSFQEHLAACEAVKPEHFPDELVEFIIEQPGNWRNVMPLLIDELKVSEWFHDISQLLDLLVQQIPTAKPINLFELTRYASMISKEKYVDISTENQTILSDNLLTIITQGLGTPSERAEMGQILAEYGDPREGVGLRADGLPDIAWGNPVPAGDYTIGGDEEIKDRSFEKKQITINYSFKLAKYPITYAQFQAFLDAQDGFQHDDWWDDMGQYTKQEMNEQRNKHANHPRENVSWYQAVAFTNWLTQKYRDLGVITANEKIRLPREEEWEVSARYPDGRFYPWGNEFDPDKANTGEGNKVGQTSPVGMYPTGKNAELDLYDMSGNVWEWCLNKYSEPDTIAIDDSNDSRVLRGGAFFINRLRARASYRFHDFPFNRYNFFGFRVVCVSILSS